MATVSEGRQAGRQALVCDALPGVLCCPEGCGLAGGPTDLTNNSYDKPVTRLSEALTDDTSNRLSPWASDITRLLVDVVMGMFSSCCTLICIQIISLIAQSLRHDTIYWHSNEHGRSSTKRMQNTRAAYQHVAFFKLVGKMWWWCVGFFASWWKEDKCQFKDTKNVMWCNQVKLMAYWHDEIKFINSIMVWVAPHYILQLNLSFIQ